MSHTVLHHAIIDNNIKLVAYLIKQGVNINVVNKNKDTPLHLAVITQNIDAVKLLLDAGADMSAINRGEFKPLALTSNAMIADMFKTKGANFYCF